MYGSRVHEAVLAAGDTVTGITIHKVNEHYDEGDVIAQTRVPVMPDDTPLTLATRVQALEHRFLIDTLATILETQRD
ncbi:MAG: formyltransferase family protein, partial [Pseudomonadota bacterium]